MRGVMLAIEAEERDLDEQLQAGRISFDQWRREVAQLHRDYNDEAHDEADRTYEAALNSFGGGYYD